MWGFSVLEILGLENQVQPDEGQATEPYEKQKGEISGEEEVGPEFIQVGTKDDDGPRGGDQSEADRYNPKCAATNCHLPSPAELYSGHKRASSA